MLSGNADEFVDDGMFAQFVDDGEVWRPLDAADVEKFSGPPSETAVANRVEFLAGDALHEPVLWYGGRFQFMELCPEWGCLAVQFGTDGEVEHAWPLRPGVLEQAWNAAAADASPPESAHDFSFALDFLPGGLSRYPNGDLLVVFRSELGRPARGGVARIDREGRPVWFRRDDSHHWPLIEDDGSALVPGSSTGDESISFPIRGTGRIATLDCPRRTPYLDTVSVIDGNGRLVKSIDLLGAMLDSPFAPLLIDASHLSGTHPRSPCDPLHLNYVRRIGDDAPDVWGMSPGDLVVSMPFVSAFAILDPESGRVKRLARGSFRYQHSVHHLGGSRFVLFDNQGTDGVHGPSRLLAVDLADGRETTIFPNEGTPEALRLFSSWGGVIDLSPDGRRALVTFTGVGVAVEVRLSDGAALNVFRSLHDVSSLAQFPEERATRPAVFAMFGLHYVSERGDPRQDGGRR